MSRIRYGATYVNKDGLRTLLNQTLCDTKEAAEVWLTAARLNSQGQLMSVIGGLKAYTSLRIDSFECYDHGDPKGIYVHEET